MWCFGIKNLAQIISSILKSIKESNSAIIHEREREIETGLKINNILNFRELRIMTTFT
jgi:hypothetical protein